MPPGAQAIVAKAQGTSSAYAQLALYLYADGQISKGDAAGERAVEAADQSQRAAIQKNMDALAEQARKQKEQLARQREQAQQGGGEEASPQIQDPFGEPRRRRKHRRSAARAGTLIEPPGDPGPIATMPLPGR